MIAVVLAVVAVNPLQIGYLNLWDIFRFRQLRMTFFHKTYGCLHMHNTILQRVK